MATWRDTKAKQKQRLKAKAKPKRAAKAKAPERPARTGMFAAADDMAARIGRPSFDATPTDRAFVKRLSALGVSMDEIGSVIGCTRQTLAKHFRQEIDDGRIEATAAVAASLFAIATAKGGGSAAVRAAEIWLRRYPAWLEAQRPKEEGDEAGANEVAITGGLPERGAKELDLEDPAAAGAGT